MAATVIVVGLGPGDPDLLGVGARGILDRVTECFVRTVHHPSSSVVVGAHSFDDIYQSATSIDDVYPAIVESLVDAASSSPAGEIVYAVPGSPLVAERTVELLRGDGRVAVEIVPALSFVDLAWARLGVDPFAVGARLVDGHRFAVEAAGTPGPLLVSQCDSALVLSEIKLALPFHDPDSDDGPGPDIVVLSRLGLPDESVTTVASADLDREVAADLTCVWIPRLAKPVAAEVVRFDELVRTLRAACPWDREQTHASLTPHLIEEAYEVLEAIDEVTDGADVGYEHLEEELGDLLFQVAFHAVIAAEAGQFTLADVARGVHDKLVRRHPHVFGAHPASSAPALTVTGLDSTWEQTKKAEKGRASIMDGIPTALPALLAAVKVGRKAASVGFDWEEVSGVWAKVYEELDELRAVLASGEPTVSEDRGRRHDELGDVLFSVANLARHLGVDPEAALRASTTKFRHRFAAMESAAAAAGDDLNSLDAAAWERRWWDAKAHQQHGDASMPG